MAVSIFRSTDGGAPAYTNAPGSLIAVLDFCLLGLGWTKTPLGTNIAAYTQPAGTNGFVLQVDDSASTYAYLCGFETLTSFNVGKNFFNPLNTPPASGGHSVVNRGSDASAKAWRLITNGSIFHFAVTWYTSSSPPYTDLCTFGDIVSYVPNDKFNTVLMGYTSPGSQYLGWAGINTQTPWNSNASTASVARAWNQISSNTLCAVMTDATLVGGSGASAGASCPNYPDPISGKLNLAPFWLADGPNTYLRGGIRGLIPGVWCILGKASAGSPAPFNDGDTFTAGAGPIAGRTFEFVGAIGSPYGQVAIETSNTWGGF